MSRKKRSMRRGCGALLCLGGLLALGFYWAWALPWSRGQSPELAPHLSPEGFWASKQRHLKSGFWWHDDSYWVGRYGDRRWAEQLMEWVADGTEMENCSAGHRDMALSTITNQDFATTAEEGWRTPWLEWWAANRDKNQEEWIQSGFEKHGIKVSLPPGPEDWPALLRVLGTAAGPSPKPYHSLPEMFYPDYLSFNAYRWLRDSGFDPVKHGLMEGPGKLSPEESGGLLRYFHYEKGKRELFAPPPGRMAFAPEWSTGMFGHTRMPAAVGLRVQPAVTTGCLLLFGVGIWLVCRPSGRPGVNTQKPQLAGAEADVK